jgi:Mrp family chromosome partitioning ATPase
VVSSVRKVVLATLLEGPYGVQVLTAGPLAAPPFEILTSPRVGNLIASLRSRADLIILDAAPISTANDAALLQRMVDGTILVVDAQRTGTRALSRALYALEVASANVIGVVLNKPKQRRWPLSHSRPMALARFEETGRSQQTAPTDLQQFNA